MAADEWNSSRMGDLRSRAIRAVSASALLGLVGPALATTPAQAAVTGRVYAAIGYANGGATLLVGHLGERAHEILQGINPGAIQLPAVAPGGHRDMSQPVWSPDGKKIYVGMRSNSSSAFYRAYVVKTDGSGPAAKIPNGGDAAPETVRHDGRTPRGVPAAMSSLCRGCSATSLMQ